MMRIAAAVSSMIPTAVEYRPMSSPSQRRNPITTKTAINAGSMRRMADPPGTWPAGMLQGLPRALTFTHRRPPRRALALIPAPTESDGFDGGDRVMRRSYAATGIHHRVLAADVRRSTTDDDGVQDILDHADEPARRSR